MPFTGFLNQEKVNLLAASDPEIYRDQDVKCKICQSRLLLVSGGNKRAHFRHQAESGCSAGEPESEKHLWLKDTVYRAAMEYFGDAELEAVVDAFGRKEVDVLTNNIAIECQVSPCSFSYVAMKNDAYLHAGLKPFWLFYTERDLKKPVRLNDVSKTVFIDGLGTGISPYAAYCNGEGVIVPMFDKAKFKNNFSKTGYETRYQLNSHSLFLTWLEFMDYLSFFLIQAK